eukprot:5731315-Pleurochrysis_carterae.AAC.1
MLIIYPQPHKNGVIVYQRFEHSFSTAVAYVAAYGYANANATPTVNARPVRLAPPQTDCRGTTVGH